MTDYRRNRVQGATYFFTVNLHDRRSSLLTIEIDHLRDAVRITRTRQPFHIDAWVVLPDHMHCLWTLPPRDADFSSRWQLIKATFSRAVPKPTDRRASLVSKREAGVWQRRFWEHTIRDDEDYAAHMDYIHFTRLSTGWRRTRRSGRFRVLNGALGLECIRPGGRSSGRVWRRPGSGWVDGLKPILLRG